MILALCILLSSTPDEDAEAAVAIALSRLHLKAVDPLSPANEVPKPKVPVIVNGKTVWLNELIDGRGNPLKGDKPKAAPVPRPFGQGRSTTARTRVPSVAGRSSTSTELARCQARTRTVARGTEPFGGTDLRQGYMQHISPLRGCGAHG
jgi:hypothetical protein